MILIPRLALLRLLPVGGKHPTFSLLLSSEGVQMGTYLILGAAGMYGFFFAEGEVKNFEDAAKQDTAKFGRWHRGMLEHGIYLAPSAYEAGFTSLAHTEEDIDKTIAAAREVMQSI